MGFLVTKANGNVEYLPVIPGENAIPSTDKIDTVISLIEKSPEIINKIRALIGNIKTKKEEQKQDSETEALPEETNE